jgi:outer membrane protein assembly factor BamB
MLPHHLNRKSKSISNVRGTAIAALALLSSFLVACAGGTMNLSWAGLAVNGELAYLAHNSFITAVHVDSGEKAWQYPEKADPKLLFYSDPLIDSGGDVVAGAYDGSVVKLDAATGTLKWILTGDGQKIIAPITEGPDGAYYASSENGSLLVIDPQAGSVKNKIALGKESSWGPMAADAKRLYVATIEHRVLAVNFADGTIDWSVDLDASIAGGVNLVDGKLVVGTFGDKVVALSPQTGETLWETPTDGWVWQAPVIAGETLFATDLSGTLRALTLAGGAPLWTAKMDAAIQAAPLVIGERVFAGASDGMVRAYSTASGVQVWELKLEGKVYGKLLADGDKLIVAVNGSKYQLAAIAPDTGTILWTFVEPT